MNTVVEIASTLSLLIGVTFVFVGAIGILRMQDVFIRMSASTKTTILGTGFTNRQTRARPAFWLWWTKP